MELDDIIADIGGRRLCYKDVVDLFYFWKIETTQKPNIIVDDLSKPHVVQIERKEPSNIHKPRKQDSGDKRTPRTWTDEEVNAIENGIRKFGIGRWSSIHKEYANIFAPNARTSSDIRLKWRTMSKHAKYQYLIPNKT